MRLRPTSLSGTMTSVRHLSGVIVTFALLAALVVAGCGGSESAAGSASAAAIAPATAPVYVSVNTDRDSEEWNRLEALLERFPGRARLVTALQEMLADEGIDADDLDRAFGPTVELVWLDLEDEGDNLVGLTQTDDEDALRDLFQDEEPAIAEIEGWTAFAEEEATLERFRQAVASGAKLGDEERFQDAMDELRDEALVKAYVNGEALTDELREVAGAFGAAGLPADARLDALAGALSAEDDGMRLGFHAAGPAVDDAPEVGELLEDVPDGVIAFVQAGLGEQADSLGSQLEGTPGAGQALDQLEQLAGVSLDDLLALFRDEFVLYVRPATLIPEVTLVAKTEDAERSRETIDSLLEAVARLTGGSTSTREIDGLEATEARLGPVSLFATAYDDRVVVTTSPTGIEDLRGDGDRLVDDERYRDALEAAGVEDGDDVFVYVDVDEAYGLVERLAQLAGEDVPQEVRENVEPLRAVVVSGTIGEGAASGSLFLALD